MTGTELGVRSIFRVENDPELSPKIHQQIYSWCKDPRKSWDADKLDGPGVAKIAPGVTASLVRDERQDGSTIERWRFHQDEGQGIWVTQVTSFVDRNDDGWVWTDDLGPSDPGVPRLLRNILEVADGLDGNHLLTAEPVRAHVDDVDEIFAAITDEERRGFLFVAGADDNVNIPLADWSGFVSKLVAGTRGIASAYALDAEATLALNARLPQSHRVQEWAIRTYLPNPVLDDPRDGIRHRILTTPRIVGDSQHRLRDLLARSARRHSTTTPVPPGLVRIDRQLRALLDETIVDSALSTAPAAPPSPQTTTAALLPPSEPTPQPGSASSTDSDPPAQSAMPTGVFSALRAAVRTVVGSAEVTVSAVTRLGELAGEALAGRHSLELVRTRMRTLESERNTLEDTNTELTQRSQDGQEELATARIDLAATETELRHLRRQLAKLDRGQVNWVPDTLSTDNPPDTFQDLLERIGEFTFVKFTGDSKPTLDLDEHGLLDWPIRTWDALRALNDYARVRSTDVFDGSVDDYISNVPPGCAGLTPGCHARGETSATQEHSVFGKARIFSVPESVERSGRIFMGAHVRIAKYGSVSPRMHYYNDAAGTGKIYVGYIGPHLPNFRTN